MRSGIAAIFAAVFCSLTMAEAEAEGFLTLPLRERSPIIRNGWYYVKTARREHKHYATDYRTTDGQDIIAACDGVAIAAESWVDASGVGSYGHFTLERCNDLAPDGSHYMAIYAHLERSAEYLASKSRYDTDYASWTSVRRGDPVGYAGQSGTNWPHVHFEVFTGDYANKMTRRVDPYNLYGLARIYPGDGVGTGTTGYLWLTFPPAAPHYTDQDGDGWNMREDCDDGNANVFPGAIEVCNGTDENCDGRPDDRWAALGTVCTVNPAPTCERRGTWVCTADESTIECNADPEVRSELCDAVDNDCDGETDEDWRTGLASDLGRPCEVGVGECRRSGVFICTPDGLGVVCDADYVRGTREVCDGLDNDCDGETDNVCLCEAVHPHPSCVCRECDVSCPVSDDHCLVVGLNPDGSIVHTCDYSYGCYDCGSRPGTEGRTCIYCMNCLWACSEFCINPAYTFCSDYCPPF